MAAKKKASAKKTAKKAAPKKTTAKKSTKVTKKTATKAAVPETGKKKRGRPRKENKEPRKKPSTLIKEIPPAALKLIQKADKQELEMAEAEDRFRETLSKIPEALGGSSFEHPERGAMTIMNRGHWYWRSKPSGTSG